MLQNIETIHQINRKLSKRLNEVQDSPNPSQDLGKLLMWFVDDMEAPYSNYCRNHEPHLDNWPEIINNTRLQNILTVRESLDRVSGYLHDQRKPCTKLQPSFGPLGNRRRASPACYSRLVLDEAYRSFALLSPTLHGASDYFPVASSFQSRNDLANLVSISYVIAPSGLD